MESEQFLSKYSEIHQLRLDNPDAAIDLINLLQKEDLDKKQHLILEIDHAYCLWIIPNVGEALEKYKSILEQSTSEELIEQKADALNGIAAIWGEKGKIPQAIQYLEEAIQIYKNLGISEKQAHATNRLGATLYNKGDFDEAQKLFESIAFLGQDDVTEINARNNIALVNMERGRIVEAVDHFKWCTEKAKELNFHRLIYTLQNNYADSLKQIGEYYQADKEFQEAFNRTRELNDIRGQAVLASSYAEFLIELGELEKAEELFKEALNIYKNFKDKYSHIVTLNAYAKFWLGRADYDSALIYLNEARDMIKKFGFKQPEIETLVSLSEVYVAIGQTDFAYSYLKEADILAWEYNSNEWKIKILIERGRINLFNLALNEAELLLLDAHHLSLQTSNVKNSFEALILLAMVYLMKYQVNQHDKENYAFALETINKVKNLAKNKKLIPDFINASIIQAMIISIKGEFKKAEEILTETKILAEKKGMKNQVRHAYERMMIHSQGIDEHSMLINSNKKDIELVATIEYIQNVVGGLPVPNLSLSDLDNIFLLSYKVDDVFGPTLLNVFNVDSNDPRYKQQIDMVGSLYIVSLGQGIEYNQGLYGPFPFGTTRLNALVYSKGLKDTSQDNFNSDTEKMVYFMLCIVYPKNISPYLYNQQKLEIFINNYMEHISSLNDVKSELLGNLYMDIMEEFFKKLLKT